MRLCRTENIREIIIILFIYIYQNKIFFYNNLLINCKKIIVFIIIEGFYSTVFLLIFLRAFYSLCKIGEIELITNFEFGKRTRYAVILF